MTQLLSLADFLFHAARQVFRIQCLLASRSFAIISFSSTITSLASLEPFRVCDVSWTTNTYSL